MDAARSVILSALSLPDFARIGNGGASSLNYANSKFAVSYEELIICNRLM